MGKLNETFLQYVNAVADRQWDVAHQLLKDIIEGYSRFQMTVTVAGAVIDPHYWAVQMNMINLESAMPSLGSRFKPDNYCLICMVADTERRCDYCYKDCCSDCVDSHGMCEHCSEDLADMFDEDCCEDCGQWIPKGDLICDECCDYYNEDLFDYFARNFDVQ